MTVQLPWAYALLDQHVGWKALNCAIDFLKMEWLTEVCQKVTLQKKAQFSVQLFQAYFLRNSGWKLDEMSSLHRFAFNEQNFNYTSRDSTSLRLFFPPFLEIFSLQLLRCLRDLGGIIDFPLPKKKKRTKKRTTPHKKKKRKRKKIPNC